MCDPGGSMYAVCSSSVSCPANNLLVRTYHSISLLLSDPSDSGSISVCHG